MTNRPARAGAALVAALVLPACASERPAPLPAETPNTPPVQSATALAASANLTPLRPQVVSEPVRHDSDDPAIWLHPTDPARSLVLGTDKDADGALYAFALDGRVVGRVGGLRRPNNVDVEYGFSLSGRPVDIAVVTERLGDTIRVFRLPDLEPLDRGAISVFRGDAQRAPMGVALYKRPRDGAVFAIVSRKQGPTEGGYLWQYRLEDDGRGHVQATMVRAFGRWCGKGEIEAVAVDDALGYVYYADEWAGVRKYLADPDAPGGDQELALFATSGFMEDREGISIYARADGTGYLLVSDQQANQFHVFPREGSAGNPHDHPRLSVVKLATVGSDGSEVTSAPLGEAFPQGLFVAMTQGATFHFYGWPDLATVASLTGSGPRRAGL
jgi:3-phytase